MAQKANSLANMSFINFNYVGFYQIVPFVVHWSFVFLSCNPKNTMDHEGPKDILLFTKAKFFYFLKDRVPDPGPFIFEDAVINRIAPAVQRHLHMAPENPFLFRTDFT